MAIGTDSLHAFVPEARGEADSHLAALPAGTMVAVFDSRIEAVSTAVQLSVSNPEGSVWLATGAQAALKIRAARAARSLLHRMMSGLTDDETFVQKVIAHAEDDKTVLVVQPRDSRMTLECLAGARHVVEFGGWTTRPIR